MMTTHGYFPTRRPWHASPEGWKGKYDPEKANFLLKKARAIGTTIDLMAANRPAISGSPNTQGALRTAWLA